MARPRGTYGPVSLALLEAAATPGTVAELARRALVGARVASFTASRLIDRRALVVVSEPGQRPAIVQRATQGAEAPSIGLGDVMQCWPKSC